MSLVVFVFEAAEHVFINYKILKMETLQMTSEIELQSPENTAIVLWAIDYADNNEHILFKPSTSALIDMLKAFKKGFTDKDWYNAGIMAQRILQTDEIEELKRKLKTGIEGHEQLVEHFKRQEKEIDVLRVQNEALKERVSIDRNNAEADRRQIAYAAWRAAADAFRMYPDNKHTFFDYWETVK